MRKRRGDCGFPGFASNVRTFSRIQDIPHICFLNITTSVIISTIAILNDMFCHHCHHRLDIFHCCHHLAIFHRCHRLDTFHRCHHLAIFHRCHHLAIFHRCHRLDIFHRSHLHARLFNKLFDQRFPICALESCAKTINSTNNEFYQKTRKLLHLFNV